MTQPPTFDFPLHRATDTRGRLAQLPILVTEALLTAGAPNPGDERSRPAGKPGSRPPVDLDLLDLTQLEDDTPATLVPLPRLAECSRLIWEALDREDEERLGSPGDPGWGTECAWLHRAWPTALAVLDRAVIDWIIDEIAAVHDDLCRRVRLRPEKVYKCPTCGDAMRLQDGGGWLLCDSGHTSEADLEARYRRMPPMPLSMVADLLGVPDATLRTWKHRRRLQPVRVERGVPWVLPWDVLLLRNPDVAEAIERRERMGA